MTTNTTTSGVLGHYIRAAQDFGELYIWRHGVNSDAGNPGITDEALYQRAVVAASADGDGTVSSLASRYLFSHARLRDSIADLAGVLASMEGTVSR